MADIGAEVGQKMRSAIKAKLMELDCYVDDELPDYIMVMVANKRTKSQMNEDLQLFLTTKTSTFVEWLHIVLKKLKEVHVTNPDVYAKTLKRKQEDLPNINEKIKKEKKDKKLNKKLKEAESEENKKSLTDDLPITANKLSEARKIIIMQGNERVANTINDDSFDIPLLSEVNLSNERELEILEKRIKSVKTRLGIQVESESEDEDFIDIKAEPEELFLNEKNDKKSRRITVEPGNNINKDDQFSDMAKQFRHARITFDHEAAPKRASILERLGKRPQVLNDENAEKRKWADAGETSNTEARVINSNRKNNSDSRIKTKSSSKLGFFSKSDKKRILQFEKPRENVLSRLGIMSKVAIPEKPKDQPQPEKEEEHAEETFVKEVSSVVKVKPRVIPANAKQANKNLLLKAVADAQRSVAQTPNVGNNINKPDALFTKKYQEKPKVSPPKAIKRKLLDTEKSKLKNIIVHIAREELKADNNNQMQEYVPMPLRKALMNDNVSYIPTVKSPKNSADNPPVVNHQFIVTLDGFDKGTFTRKDEALTKSRATPSPIVFDKTECDANVPNIPEALPRVSTSPLKNKERCKYWPLCKLLDKCEFVHPTIQCKMFPSCKFGDKCLYVHPMCKFEASCTRRDCPYSHTATAKIVASRIVPPTSSIHVAKQTLQTCKFFPQCSNPHCTFYHPKPCKFGKFCKNQSECNFSHTYLSKSSNLTWRSDKA